jgi:hypothetical protein
MTEEEIELEQERDDQLIDEYIEWERKMELEGKILNKEEIVKEPPKVKDEPVDDPPF